MLTMYFLHLGDKQSGDAGPPYTQKSDTNYKESEGGGESRLVSLLCQYGKRIYSAQGGEKPVGGCWGGVWEPRQDPWRFRRSVREMVSYLSHLMHLFYIVSKWCRVSVRVCVFICRGKRVLGTAREERGLCLQKSRGWSALPSLLPSLSLSLSPSPSSSSATKHTT